MVGRRFKNWVQIEARYPKLLKVWDLFDDAPQIAAIKIARVIVPLAGQWRVKHGFLPIFMQEYIAPKRAVIFRAAQAASVPLR